MVDFNLVLELLAVLATLAYMVLLVNENFARDGSTEENFTINNEPFLSSNFVKKSLHGQRISHAKRV